MDLLLTIKKLQEQVQHSPLFNELGYAELQEINADLELLAAKLEQPLRIALIGEVKAGKSTLINAFAGGQVSPTNVTESTACIMQIGYAGTEEAAIVYSNGKEQMGTPGEIYAVLKQHENEQDFFSGCEFVRVNLPLHGLRYIHMIDTPGLATITESNAQRTEKYFQAVDVVLWVLNGNYLGQSDINDVLRKVADMGKPIVGVINRIDEVDGDPEDLVAYVEDSIGIYFEAIFPLSARKAFMGVLEQNAEMKEQSGFAALYRYLEENIDRDADAVQLESIKASTYALAGKAELIHKQALEQIHLKLETYMKLEKEIEHSAKMFQEKIVGQVHAWIFNGFLNEIEQELAERVDDMGAFSLNGGEKVQQILRDELTAGRIEAELNAFVDALNQTIQEAWQVCLAEIDGAIGHAFQDMLERQRVDSYSLADRIPKMTDGMDAITNSLLTAGTIGGTLATYAAVIGPAAAHVSMGAALSAFMPPVMIAGAVVGVASGYVKSKKVKEQYRTVISAELSGIRSNVENEMLPKIMVYLQDMCESTKIEAKRSFVEKNFNGHSEAALAEMIERLQSMPAFLEEERLLGGR